jgi:TetR/AcrR family transcriptional repressor of nem operon
MRKSRADAAETRKRILSTASDLFLKNGVTATAISDVMVAAGLTQGGFYRHFESKEQLLAEANATAFEESAAGFDAATAGLAPCDAVNAIVHRYLHQQQGAPLGRLCPLATLSSEIRHSDPQVKAVVLDGYSRLIKLIASYLMRLDYVDYVGLATSIVATMVGAVSISQLAVEEAARDVILRNAESTVALLLQASESSSDRKLSRY